jgi:polyhydroxyalkanoate synthesis regulator phasin
MAKNPMKNAIDASKDVTAKAQDWVEALVNEVSRTTEESAAQVQTAVQDLVDRSRENTERVGDVVAKQVQAQLEALGLATQADVRRLERKIDALKRDSSGSKSTKQRASKKRSAKKSTSKKRAASKSKTAAKKSSR